MPEITSWLGYYISQGLVLIIVTLVLVRLVQLTLEWFTYKLPPGPVGLPVVGYLPWVMRAGPLDTFRRLADRYGPIWSMKMGMKTMVVLSDYDTVKEALVGGATMLSDRDRPVLVEEITQGALGIAHSNFPLLRELRKFSLTALRGCGVGKKSLEQRLHQEIEMYCMEVRTASEKSTTGFDLKNLTASAVSNIICSIVFGERYEYSDSQFALLLQMMAENFAVSQTGASFLFIPLLRYLPPFNKTITHIQTNLINIKDFVMNRIKEHRESFDASNLRDIIDMYLKAQQDTPNADPKDIKNFTSDPQMVKVILDLFFAGTETTSTTLLWAYLFMCLNPEVQEKCREEIVAVFGNNSLPSVDRREQLVYTEATIMEIQRQGDIAPFAIMHFARSNTKLKGYDIPQNAYIIPHLNYLHRDKKYWSKPNDFNPERFIDSNGKLMSKPDSFLPFSIGRRVCLGEALARMELFLFFTTVLQRFRLELADGEREKLPDMEGHLGLTRSPHAFQVIVIPL